MEAYSKQVWDLLLEVGLAEPSFRELDGIQ